MPKCWNFFSRNNNVAETEPPNDDETDKKKCWSSAVPTFCKFHRKSERVNAGTQVINSTASLINPVLEIPGKFVQLGSSASAIIYTNNMSEKLIHTLQVAIVLGQIITLSWIYFDKDENCINDPSTSLCMAAIYLEFCYTAFLTTGWFPSEVSKETTPTPPAADEENQEMRNVSLH